MSNVKEAAPSTMNDIEDSTLVLPSAMFYVCQCVQTRASLTFDIYDFFDTYDIVEIHFLICNYLTNKAHTRKDTGTQM